MSNEQPLTGGVLLAILGASNAILATSSPK
jgi:hypothetical protein